MEIKGTAFLARKAMAEREFGAERFAEVLRKVSDRDRIFRAPVLATTRIPIDAFIRLNDAMVRDLYGGDEQSYFRFGEQSAAWALTDGPYKKFVADRSIEDFAASASTIYRNYYTDGRAEGTIDGKTVRLALSGIDAPHRHVYFEYAIMGYFKRGLEMVSGGHVRMTRKRGFSKGDAEVLYEFELD